MFSVLDMKEIPKKIINWTKSVIKGKMYIMVNDALGLCFQTRKGLPNKEGDQTSLLQETNSCSRLVRRDPEGSLGIFRFR
jgi:hypothetical protein